MLIDFKLLHSEKQQDGKLFADARMFTEVKLRQPEKQ